MVSVYEGPALSAPEHGRLKVSALRTWDSKTTFEARRMKDLVRSICVAQAPRCSSGRCVHTANRRLNGNDWVKVRSGMMPSHFQAPLCCYSGMNSFIHDLSSIGGQKLKQRLRVMADR